MRPARIAFISTMAIFTLLFTIHGALSYQVGNYSYDVQWNETAEQGASPVAYGWSAYSGTNFAYTTVYHANGSKSFNASADSTELYKDFTNLANSTNYNISFKTYYATAPGSGSQLFSLDDPSALDLAFGYRVNNCPNGWAYYSAVSHPTWAANCVGTVQTGVWQTHLVIVNATHLNWSVDGQNIVVMSLTSNYQKKLSITTSASSSNLYFDDLLIWNASLTPAPPSVTTITLQLFNNVTGESMGTTYITNITGVLDFTFTNVTGAGFCVTYTGNGTGSNCTATGAGVGTFFNASANATVTGDTTIQASTYQARLQLMVQRLFLGTNIASFNVTDNLTRNTTSSSTAFLKALNGTNNVQVDVAGNYSKNVTCTITAPLTTNQCNATGIHDNYYAFNATDAWNNEVILNFSLTVSNGTLGGTLYSTNTTNGTINMSLLQDYTYFIQFTTENGTWEYTNITLAANTTNQFYEFEVLPAPSIDITIRDAATGSLIVENITIVLTSNTTGDTVYTTTGGYFATDLSPEQYTIKLSNANYSQSVYVVTASQGAVYYLTAYLQKNVSDVVMQFVDSIASTVPIAGALVTQQALVNGTWQAVSTKLTDVTGRTIFGYLDGVAYRFIAIADGYQTKDFTLDPVLFSTYQIKMTRSTALDFDEDFQSVYVAYTPTIFYDGQQNQVNITFTSPLGTFVSYSYNVTYPGGSIAGDGSNIIGETFTRSFNITGATYLDRVNVTLSYDPSIGAPRNFSYSNLIVISPGNTTFIKNQDNTYGLGLLERLIIGTIILVIAAGIVTAGAGPLWGLGIGLFVMGVFLQIGFWPWWAAGLSFLVGFALIAGRTD